MQRTSTIVIGLLVVVVAVVIGFILLSSGPAPAPESSPSPSESASVAPPSAEASFNADLLDRRWTVLYVGTDQNEEREAAGEQLNTDALMLVSLSADQSTLSLVSLPRDSIDIPLADGGTWDRKINGLYRERGIDELIGAMETLYGIPVDAHVLLDMDDFARLVDAVDDIDVSPPEPVVDPIVNLDLAAGDQTLDGTQTLGYVRTRVDQDYGRMARQQEVLVSLITRFLDPDADIDLRAVLDSLDSLETDLPLDDLPTLLELARRASTAQLQTLVIQPPLITFEGDRNDGRGYVVEPDVAEIRDEVQTLLGD